MEITASLGLLEGSGGCRFHGECAVLACGSAKQSVLLHRATRRCCLVALGLLLLLVLLISIAIDEGFVIIESISDPFKGAGLLSKSWG